MVPGAVALALAVLGLSFGFFATPASAHATLERTRPATDAHLDDEPNQVVLSFDQPVDLKLGQVTVVGPGGAPAATGYTQSDGGTTVTIALHPGAGNGTYVVSYRVISLDTHPVSGGFFFRVGHGSAATGPTGSTPGAAPPTTAASGSAPEDTTVRALYAACRYAGFVGLLLLVGGAVFLAALWPAEVPDRRARRLVWFGYGLVAVASLGELVLQAPYAAGTALSGITGADFDHVVATRFGTAHLVRLGLLALTAPVLVGLRRPPRSVNDSAIAPRRARWPILSAATLGVGLLLTWAYSGHAGTTVPAVSVPSDVVHLAAMAVWVGGLVVLAAALLPAAAGASLGVTLPRWSRLAMISVAALIITGTVQSLLEVGGWAGLGGTAYGQLLLAKIGILAVILVVADFSRRWVRRHFLARPAPTADAGAGGGGRLGPSRDQIARLRRGVAVESVLAVGAVAVATVLIQAAPGRSVLAAPLPSASTAPPITRHGAYRASVRQGDVVIHLKVDPAVVGVQYIYVGAFRPDGERIPVRQWTLTVSNERLGLHRVDLPVTIDIGVGRHDIYSSFTMPTGGTWTVQVTARTSDVDETVVTRKVRVRS